MNDKSKDEGVTALHIAARHTVENEKLFRCLLGHPHIDVNAQSRDKWTPLHYLCQRGFARSVSCLHYGHFCCLNEEGDSPLHLAAANHHYSIFTVLSETNSFQTRYKDDPAFTEMKVIPPSQSFNFEVIIHIFFYRMQRETLSYMLFLIQGTVALSSGASHLDSKSICAIFAE